MKKLIKTVSIIILVLMATIILAFLGIKLYTNDSYENYESAHGVQDPNEIKQIQSSAIASGDYTICNKVAVGLFMSAATPRFDCYQAVIKKIGDQKMCQEMKLKQPNEHFGFYAKDNCLITVAGKLKNLDVCSEIDDQAQYLYHCYTEVAAAKNDISICDKIPLTNVQAEPQDVCKDEVRRLNNSW